MHELPESPHGASRQRADRSDVCMAQGSERWPNALIRASSKLVVAVSLIFMSGTLAVSSAYAASEGPSARSAEEAQADRAPSQTIRINKKHSVMMDQMPSATSKSLPETRGPPVETKPFLPAPIFPPSAPSSKSRVVPENRGLHLQLLPGEAPTGNRSAEQKAAPATATLERLTSFAGLGQNGKTPSDTVIAVGPDFVIQMVNVTGQIYDKAGNVKKTFDTGTFFACPGGAGSGTDPRVVYDAPSGRFFAAYECNPAGGDETDVAVSDSADPTAGWSIYIVKSNNANVQQDQQKLGLTNDKVSLSWNDYDITDPSNKKFTGVETAIINKAELLAGGTITITIFGPDKNRFQIVPAVSLSSVNDHFMLWHAENDTKVKALTVTGVPGVSAVNMSGDSDVDIGAADAPPAAATPAGGDASINTNDGRMLSVAWQNNQMWGAFNVKCTPPGDSTTRACIRYVQVATSGFGLGTNFNLGMNGGDIYFGSVGLNQGDDLFSSFTASSTAIFPTAVAIGVPGGNFPAVLTGDFYYAGVQAPVVGNRWGDYFNVARDPVNPTDVWTVAQAAGFTNPAGGWGTGIGRFTLSGPTVTGISPTHGPELAAASCNLVTVNGTDFTPSSSVMFGAAAGSGVNVLSPNQLKVSAPSGAKGSVDVTVTTANGTSPTSFADQFTYDADLTAPVTQALVSPAPINGWNKTASVGLSATDGACGSGVKSITYSAAGAQPIGSTTVGGSSTTVAIASEGSTTLSYMATDNANNTEITKTLLVKIDATPPVISCGAADGLWHATDVNIGCTASDALSGLGTPSDASFSLSTSVAAGTETSNASTNSRSICDLVSNCATAGPVGGNRIDKKPPTVAIAAPASGATYLINQLVASSYACSDGGSGVATCTGPVASGSNFNTSAVGVKAFTVNATDNVGNPSSLAVNYNVTYNICLKYDPTKAAPAGATVSIRLQLCDANNVNLSSKSITVTAVSVTPTGTLSSNSNPGNVFVLSTGIYVYNLSTKAAGFVPGSYNLQFTVAGDPIVHSVPFMLK